MSFMTVWENGNWAIRGCYPCETREFVERRVMISKEVAEKLLGRNPDEHPRFMNKGYVIIGEVGDRWIAVYFHDVSWWILELNKECDPHKDR